MTSNSTGVIDRFCFVENYTLQRTGPCELSGSLVKRRYHAITVQTADGSQTHIFYAPKIKGGADTVTFTFSGTNNHPFVAIYEYSGVTTLDSTAHAMGSDANPNSGTTAQASSANELIFGGLDLPSSSAVSVAAGSGWTIELQDANQNGSRAAT